MALKYSFKIYFSFLKIIRYSLNLVNLKTETKAIINTKNYKYVQ